MRNRNKFSFFSCGDSLVFACAFKTTFFVLCVRSFRSIRKVDENKNQKERKKRITLLLCLFNDLSFYDPHSNTIIIIRGIFYNHVYKLVIGGRILCTQNIRKRISRKDLCRTTRPSYFVPVRNNNNKKVEREK